MLPIPLPAGSLDPIDLGEGITLVGYQRAVTILVPELEATLAAAGWVTETAGGLQFGGMWVVTASKGDECWTVTAQGVDDSAQLSIARAE